MITKKNFNLFGRKTQRQISKFCYILRTKRYRGLHRDDSLNHRSDEKGEQNRL